MTYNFFLKNNNINLNIITHKQYNNKAVLIHIHGLGSHFQSDFDCIDSFINKVKIFKDLNIISYGLELRGHGKSTGIQNHINCFTEYLSDLDTLINYIILQHKNIPIYLLGHSLGGAIAINYSIKYKIKNNIAGVILLAPMCGLYKKYNWITIICLYILSYIFPKWKYITLNNTSEDPYYISIKLLSYYTDKYMLCMGRECFNAINYLNKNIKIFDIPIIIFHSSNDDMTDYKSSENFINLCNSKDKTFKLIPNSSHYLLGEDPIIAKNIMSNIYVWLNKRING